MDFAKIITDPKDAELAWVCWKTSERQGYRVRFLNPGQLFGYRSGKTRVMVRGFNVSNSQVNGSGDNLSEQSRPLLQVEDVRQATGRDSALLESRDWGFYTVDLPNFWERREMSGLLRDVNKKPDKYSWLGPAAAAPLALDAPSAPDLELDAILEELRIGAQD